MKDASQSLILPRIVSQHAEDASFLWLLRDGAVAAPQFKLKDLASLDNRVEANLDGLRIAGEPGWEICEEVLRFSDAGEVFACAVLAFESSNDARIQRVLEKGVAEPALARGVASALAWTRHEKTQKHIQSLISSRDPSLRWVGIAATAIHRQDPGKALIEAVYDGDFGLKARALRAVGELGRLDLRRVLLENLDDKNEESRFSAAWSADLLSTDTKALRVLQTIAESESPYREKAMQMALRRMDLPAANAWQTKLANSPDPKSLRWAIIAAGVIGDPVVVPWLIEQMKIPPLSRVAGEAFTMITGADLAAERLRGEKPEGFESGPNENPEDENVEMDLDENLDWPNPEFVAKWWSAHQSNLQKGTRHLLGKPITADWMQHVLRAGKQRQRAAAALELAMRQPGQPLFNVAAPGFRQQRLLGIGR